MDFLTSTTHMHITTWVIALILFFVAALSSKKLTAVHMVLRLFYILLIVTGGALFIEWRGVEGVGGMMYDMKVLFALILIGLMEMILVGKNKGKPLKVKWILFAIVLVITLFIGLSSGIGMSF